MKPNAEGGIILEGGRDRRYLRVAARVIGSTGLLEHVHTRADATYNRFLDQAQRTLSGSNVAGTYRHMHGYGFANIVDTVGTGRGVADQMARVDMLTADVPLEPGFTNEALRGLQAVADLDRIGAMRHMVRRPVAQAMLDGYSAALPQ